MAKRRPTRPSPQPPPAGADAPSPSVERVEGNGIRPPATEPGPRWHRWLGALLFVVVLGVFLPALRHDFVTYDDPAYVVENPHVNTGLSWANFRWAWTSLEHSNWHPLTWLSHQLDCTLFGLAPWGHHLTNLLLHAASAVLLFVVLRRATGFLWRSLVVAALFGLHPLRVESVAWIAERKDVLSVFLGLLALWAYVAYAQRAQARQPRVWLPYAGALVAFAASLTAKPMLVTLPCVLLLLDLWPLGRWPGGDVRARVRLVFEKLPFLALAAVSCALTTKAQAAGGAVQAIENFPLAARVANALIAYGQYLGKLFWPAELAVLYPNFGEQPPLGRTMLALALLLGLTAAAEGLRRRRPWAPVGWLWFLGTLVPVIGLVQVGGQTMADRYSYFPTIGIFLVLVWAVAEFCPRRPLRPLVLGLATAAALLACLVLTSRQLARWRNSFTLFQHTLAVTEDNWMAHFNLYLAYAKTPGCNREAREEFQQTTAIIARFAERQNQRGLALLHTPGRLTDAVAAFEKAIRIKGDEPSPHLNLGRALAQAGRSGEAIAQFRIVLRLDSENGEARLGLGRALAQQPEHLEEAINELRLAVWLLDAARADTHCALADALAQDPRRCIAALAEYERALQLDPHNAEAKAGLARLRGQ